MTEWVTIGRARLACADCREVLPTLPKHDLLLTDPPYGIGRDGKPPSTSSCGGHKGYQFLGWDFEPPNWLTIWHSVTSMSPIEMANPSSSGSTTSWAVP